MKKAPKKTAVRAPKFLLYQSTSDDRWYAPLVDRNGKTIWPSVPYSTKGKAKASLRRLTRVMSEIVKRKGPICEQIND